MNIETIKYILLFGGFIIATLLLSQTFIIQHETVHGFIAEDHQCIEGHVEVLGLTSGQYVCDTRTKGYNALVAEKENYLHNIHESISYNTRMVMVTIILCTLFIGGLMVIKTEKKEEPKQEVSSYKRWDL
jgi:hypothetical protein